MHRIMIEIPLPLGLPPLTVYSYGLMMVLAFAVTVGLTVWRAKRIGVPADLILDLSLYALVSGIIGARLAYLLVDYVPDPASEHPLLDLVALWKGGLTFQGGLALALFVCIWYLHSRKMPAARIADLFAPGLAFGVALGRVGCYLNGCCWGKLCPADFAGGVVFPGPPPGTGDVLLRDLTHTSGVFFHQYNLWQEGAFAPLLKSLGYTPEFIAALDPTKLPLPVYPAQLYSAALLAMIGILLFLLDLLPRRFDGQLMLAFVFLYSGFRFGIEFLRDDTPAYFAWGGFSGLRLGQLLALAMALTALGFAVYLWRRAGATPPPPPAAQPPETPS